MVGADGRPVSIASSVGSWAPTVLLGRSARDVDQGGCSAAWPAPLATCTASASGGVLGWRMVLIEHTGRRSGLPRQTVVEVIGRRESAVDVAAAWGDRSDWLRNLRADPTCRISTGSWRRRPAVASVLHPTEAAAVLSAYAERHRRAAAALSRRFDLPFDEPERLAEVIPVLQLSLITPR